MRMHRPEQTGNDSYSGLMDWTGHTPNFFVNVSGGYFMHQHTNAGNGTAIACTS